MRISATCLVLCAAVTACTDPSGADDDAPRLLIDVWVSDSAVSIQAQEPERPCQCSFGWTEVGACRNLSDAIGCTCEPWPASCLEEVAVLAGGERLAEAAWDPYWLGAFLSLDTAGADTLSITGCGADIAVAIPAGPRPDATLEVDDAGTAAWSSEPPAATSVIGIGDGYVTESCHRLGGAGEVSVPSGDQPPFLSLIALAKPEVRATALGTVRIWSGNQTDLLPP